VEVKSNNFAAVLADDPPQNRADRPKNTFYVGKEGKAIQPLIRIYDYNYHVIDGERFAKRKAVVPILSFRVRSSVLKGLAVRIGTFAPQ
jgi:hypothetical protein